MKWWQHVQNILQVVLTWTALVSLWTADVLIRIMLIARSDERRVRPTERIPWPKGLKQDLMRRQQSTCAYCGHRQPAYAFEIDHMTPVVRGGSNDRDNLQVICRSCNMRKGIQTDQEFRSRYSRLIPSQPLTPPRRRVSQREFSAATQRTSQSDVVRKFRKSRFYTKREKILTGCLILAGVTGFIMLLIVSYLGVEGLPALLPPMILGAALALSIWLRAYKTGAMIEEE